MVTDGKIRGYSIGGKAERLYVDMEEIEKEDGPGVNSVHVDTIMSPSKKKPKKEETV
jgi:DNA-directed RNA polymerase alpha subunit